MRERADISLDMLRACLREEYNLAAATIECLPLGHDYHARVYRVVSEQGTGYLLKVTSRPLYESSCLVPRYLHDQGITAVVAPLSTISGSLWKQLSAWTVLLYPFLEGDASSAGMPDAQWQEAGRIVRQIHQATLPPGGFPTLCRESFDPSSYLKWARAFPTKHLLQSQHGGGDSARALLASWAAHHHTIQTAASSLEELAAVLQSRTLPFVIAHADLHAANLLRDEAGRVFLLDWDEVMLAPKERDFIFIREPHDLAFWEGYGGHVREETDWTALTYFRWERVIQDLIYEAQQVLDRDDVSEDSKAIAADRFTATFAMGNHVAAAYAAAAHLSSNPPTPRQQNGTSEKH